MGASLDVAFEIAKKFDAPSELLIELEMWKEKQAQNNVP